MKNNIKRVNTTVNKIKSVAMVASLTFALSACGGGSSKAKTKPSIEPVVTTSIDYQEVIDGVVSESIPGIVLLVETPEKRFLGSAGVESSESQNPMQVYHTMPTASAGKPMIGLLAVMLADEGLLDLDDALDTWLSHDILSQIPHSEEITLRQLLNHTSGIFNYVDNPDYLELLAAEPSKVKTDMDFLALGLNQPAYFEPGDGIEYSNTGYLLAGLIMDQVLGQHHSTALRERILEPLGLDSTYYRGVEKTRGDFISGYHSFDGDSITYNTKSYLENVSQASSPLVSSVEDMAWFLKSTIGDQNFISASVRDEFIGSQQFAANNTNSSYGLGIVVEKIGANTAYFHAGLTYGYHTQNIYIKEKDLSITAFINCSTAPTCENTMDSLVEKVLENEL